MSQPPPQQQQQLEDSSSAPGGVHAKEELVVQSTPGELSANAMLSLKR